MFNFISKLINKVLGKDSKPASDSPSETEKFVESVREAADLDSVRQDSDPKKNKKNEKTTGGMMAEISINGRKKVSTLKREFKAEYGLTLDVKKGKSNVSAEPYKTLSSVRDESAPSGSSFTIRSNMKVGNLEKKFLDMGVKINIKTAGGGFISNDKTLGSVRKKDK